MSTEFLRQLPLLAGLSDSDLQRLHDMAENVELAPGEVLMREGTEGNSLYLVIEGEFEISKRSGEKDVVIARRGAGEVMGEMSLLAEAPRSATVTATRPSRLIKLGHDRFQELLSSSPSAALAILDTVTSRLRSTEGMLRQHEKMAGLGTLAAGVAHELNNPAAAIRRAASHLKEALVRWQQLSLDLARLPLEPPQREFLARLELEVAEPKPPPALDALERSDLESAIQETLEAQGVDDAWELASPLVNFGWDLDRLQTISQTFEAQSLAAVLRWVAASCEVSGLTSELFEGAKRISNIVGSVKTYSYLDQAPVQDVDLHRGLEDTLMILQHKLGPDIEIERRFDLDLPTVEAYGSELNQVWTNLIDNAIDAINGSGKITLETRRRDGNVEVIVCDDGPGVPEEIQERIFEPFYTTKPPGVGTGLGLHIVYNIVVDRHLGSITLTSEPGATCFSVSLPISRRDA